MRRFILTFIAIISICATYAQTLDECRQLAREHYPEIRQYDLINATEQYNLSNAARAWIPQIKLSAQASYQSATPTYPDAFRAFISANGIEMDGIHKDQYKVSIDITQNIWDGGQSKADKSLAQAEATEQRSRTEVSLYQLQSRVDDLYFGILLLDEKVAQTITLIEVLESNLKRVQTCFDNGTAQQSDIDIIEAELLTARQSLQQVEASRANYRQMLEIFIGTNLTHDKLERPDMNEPTCRVSARPELTLFDAQQRKLDAQRNMINTSVMPRFSAFAQGFYGYPGLDMFKSMMSSEWRLDGMIGVKMSWNIGAFYTKNNDIKKLDIKQQQIDIQRDVFLFNSNLQTSHEDSEIARLRKVIDDDDRIVELRHRVRIAAESQLTNGVIDTTELLKKISDETIAKLNKSSHEIELLQATYRLKNILNQ